MGIFELTPSIRADKEAFNKALNELGWSKQQYVNKIKRAGISFNDKTSTKNFLNSALKKAGSSFRYKNIMQAPTKIATEVGMGGVEPGKSGAPKNAKIWQDGQKIQKIAEKKFKNLTDQRKFFVDTMQKIYKNIPKKQILHIFKNILQGVKSFSPFGIAETLSLQMMEDPEFMNAIGLGEPQPMTFNQGGMMDINQMTRPIGYATGGFENRMEMLKESMRDDENQRMREPDITSVAFTIAQQQGNTSEENINRIIRQLMALMPSVNQTMEKELTPTSTKGIKYLMDKLGVMTGQQSDPMLRRDVGFERVR